MPFDSIAISAAPSCGTRFNCAACPSSGACIIRGANAAELAGWTACLEAQLSLPHAGKELVDAGAAADAIWSVRAGCLKSCTVDAEGNERVRAFHLPGDLIGLDALGASTFGAQVVAVVPSQVCRIPRARALEMLARNPGLMRRMLERTSADLAQALALSGDYTADQRVAAFLLSMQGRLHAQSAVRLPMTRRDIANYLRLATETVCRALTRFEARGWLASQDKTIHLLQPNKLADIAAPVGLHGRTTLAKAA